MPSVQITAPTANAQLNSGSQFVSANVSGVSYEDIVTVRCMIARAGELPSNPNFVPPPATFLNCNNPSANPMVFAANWVSAPMPPMGQTYQCEVGVWLVYRTAQGAERVACSVTTPPM